MRALKVAQPNVELGRRHIRVVVPIRTAPGLNAREHWAKRSSRVAAERAAVHVCWPRHFGVEFPCIVTLTRVGPRLADDDNVVGALKHCRDEVAAILGVGDSPADPVQWFYGQRKGPWAVEIEVRWASSQAREAK